ncbi:uncharacterized protein CMU_042590 [Cryptosporidium muris RN66]|uniref:Ubiquitin-like domain-containing protein n=1 Tax=Cryptosporidium muris (strain RN66) TaxID=441375 RepID=B6AAE4_CRYMR|nr:uncharacterized protein CMU_042590 [Cryptosporidium muris RN66]EEA05185.1 hypothetical protein, conserved [Cryptosporidium muris RN66]|eukprot:XP_002139534.1 hypothetical protein [Cryptosporidium muris RN66]
MESDYEESIFGHDISFSKKSVAKRLGIQIKPSVKYKSVQKELTNNEKTLIELSSSSSEDDNKEDNIDNSLPKEYGSHATSISSSSETLRVNVKVYTRQGADITVIKTLIVTLYRSDLIMKLVTFISNNLLPMVKIEKIKVFFDGDLLNYSDNFNSIGIEDNEQLDVKVPFECTWKI